MKKTLKLNTKIWPLLFADRAFRLAYYSKRTPT